MFELTNLALDLFAGPSGSITCTSAEVLVCTSLSRHSSEEVMAEILPDLAILERICNVTIDGQLCS